MIAEMSAYRQLVKKIEFLADVFVGLLVFRTIDRGGIALKMNEA